ncbi:hypothetical protein [Halofilum ochraceum]|uniref:hypothetical protein n=1 Tax=Halofilum ochraceum TaxID=1611323 RepID=UPI0011130910|nr:hypothetical protein [Halofilum ochraceum]
MSESGRTPGVQDSGKEHPVNSDERDRAVPDLEVDSSVDGNPDRSRQRSPSTLREFGGGQWLLLWFFITLGVTCGNLLSNAITSAAVAYQLQVAMSEVTESFKETSAEARQEAQAAAERRQAEQRERRRESDRGQSLARQCQDWRAAHEDMDTYTTRTKMNEYCGAYREYIRTGRVSRE